MIRSDAVWLMGVLLVMAVLTATLRPPPVAPTPRASGLTALWDAQRALTVPAKRRWTVDGIALHMSMAEVRRALGRPYHKSGSALVGSWEWDYPFTVVVFNARREVRGVAGQCLETSGLALRVGQQAPPRLAGWSVTRGGAIENAEADVGYSVEGGRIHAVWTGDTCDPGSFCF